MQAQQTILVLGVAGRWPICAEVVWTNVFYVNDVTWPNQLRDNWHRSAELLASEMASVQYEMKQAYDGSSQVVKPLINTCH